MHTLGMRNTEGGARGGGRAGWKRVVAVLGAAVAARSARAQSLGPFPLEGTVDWAYQQAVGTALPGSTGVGPADVQTLTLNMITFWRSFQDATGAIIDPVENYEIQYATPMYAFSCARLVVQSPSQYGSFLPSCVAALNSSILDVSAGTAPQGHNNFFILPVMLTKQIVAPLVSTSTMTFWNATLQTLNPVQSYNGYPANNWGLVAVAGEYLRVQQGLCRINCSWWEQELTLQVNENSFTANGQYQDHSGTDGLNPLAYDTFARTYIVSLVLSGYTGPYLPLFQQVVERGAEMSALLQTPRGDIALGGRSQMHTWNQAAEYFILSLRTADMVAAGNGTKACQFRRSANLALQSLLRWQSTPAEAGVTGARNGSLLFINMCREPAANRCGYMSYSYLSQYNLLPLAQLNLALYLAPTAIGVSECAAYTDAGGFSFEIPEFKRVVANAGGTYVGIETGADPEYDSTGIQRVQVGRSASGNGIGSANEYGPLSSSWWINGALALGPIWTLHESCPGPLVDSLANQTYADVTGIQYTPMESAQPGIVAYSVQFFMFDRGISITETISIAPGGAVNVSVSATHPGLGCSGQGLLTPFVSFGISVPVLAFDGIYNSTVSINSATSSVSWSNPTLGTTEVSVHPASGSDTLSWTQGNLIVSPNGLLQNVTAVLHPGTNNPVLVFQLQTYAP
jgi:hypothetical protein